MSEVNPPGFLQNAGNVHTAEILRSSYSGLQHGIRTAGSLVARGGVVPFMGGVLAVTQNGSPNMSVNVASGQVYVPGTEGTKQGTYACVNDATKNVTITAADGSNPRIDLVVAKVQDTLYSGAVNSWSLAIVTGTPSGSPAVPTAPANSVTLAQIAVGAGVTSILTANITDKRFYVAAVGGVIQCTSATRPATTTVPVGSQIFETDTNLLYILIGSTWKLVMPYRQNNTLGGTAATVTFSSIPTSLKRIQVSFTIRGDASSSGIVRLRINGDSGANYSWQLWNSFTVGTSNTSATAQVGADIVAFPTGGGAGIWAAGRIEFMGWDVPHATQLTGISQSGYIFNTSGASNNTYAVWVYSGASGSGYTSITLTQTTGNFLAGSEFLLEGWD